MAFSMPYASCKIDAKGQRFNAVVTSVVLAFSAFLFPHTVAFGLLIWQTIVFGVGVVFGPHKTPVAFIYKKFIRPRAGIKPVFENSDPPRFAQGVGFVFAGSSLLFTVLGFPVLAFIAVVCALSAALISAVFDICLGCEMYMFIQKHKTAAV